MPRAEPGAFALRQREHSKLRRKKPQLGPSHPKGCQNRARGFSPDLEVAVVVIYRHRGWRLEKRRE
jgi:hypothetical protein